MRRLGILAIVSLDVRGNERSQILLLSYIFDGPAFVEAREPVVVSLAVRNCVPSSGYVGFNDVVWDQVGVVFII